jgi:hypothetical protein
MRIQEPHLKSADFGESGMHIGRERRFQHTSLRGASNARIHTFIMLSTAADLAAALVNDLPPDVRNIVEAHFFDGESIFTIQRRYKMRRRDLEAMIEAALLTMRTALQSRGVGAVGDVI